MLTPPIMFISSLKFYQILIMIIALLNRGNDSLIQNGNEYIPGIILAVASIEEMVC